MKTSLAGLVCLFLVASFSSLSSAKDEPGVWGLASPRGKDSPESSTDPRQDEFGTEKDCSFAEPRPMELVWAAWEHSGLKRERESSLETRVRVSGWFPRLSGGLSYDLGDKWDYKYKPGEPRVDQLHQNNGLSWDVGITLDLSRTVYQDEELALLKESSRRAAERRDLALEVIRLVYARRQLMLHKVPEPGSMERTQLDEYTAVLDAWTGGVFRDRWCTKEVSR